MLAAIQRGNRVGVAPILPSKLQNPLYSFPLLLTIKHFGLHWSLLPIITASTPSSQSTTVSSIHLAHSSIHLTTPATRFIQLFGTNILHALCGSDLVVEAASRFRRPLNTVNFGGEIPSKSLFIRDNSLATLDTSKCWMYLCNFFVVLFGRCSRFSCFYVV